MQALSMQDGGGRWRALVRKLALTVLVLGGAPLAHADLWAFVDEFGVTHFAAEALDERYKLYFKGDLYDSAEQGLKPGAGVSVGVGAQGLQAGGTRAVSASSAFDVSPRYRSVRPHVQKAAQKTGVEYELLKAVIAVESGFDPAAVSPKGAVGLMQLMPATAQRFGVASTQQKSLEQQLADPAVNVPAGARYLNYLLKLFPGRLDLALAAYNAGEGAVRKAGQAIPPFKETRNYVKAVLGIYEQLQAGKPHTAAHFASVSLQAPAAGGQAAAHARVRMTLPAPSTITN